jgi:pyruvate dehydrogenase (quinone)
VKTHFGYLLRDPSSAHESDNMIKTTPEQNKTRQTREDRPGRSDPPAVPGERDWEARAEECYLHRRRWIADGLAASNIPATGESRTIISLSHGTMANAMPQALGAKKAQPHRQVISLSGDGGLAMMLGDLITAIQEDIPIKVAVFNNSSLGFVELEQKVEGLLDAYTNLKNPDFARVAESIGFWGMAVDNADELDAAVASWLGQPGPALLDVHVDRMELVIPPKIEAAQVFGTALYSAKALLSGRGGDVLELLTDNFLN